MKKYRSINTHFSRVLNSEKVKHWYKGQHNYRSHNPSYNFVLFRVIPGLYLSVPYEEECHTKSQNCKIWEITINWITVQPDIEYLDRTLHHKAATEGEEIVLKFEVMEGILRIFAVPHILDGQRLIKLLHVAVKLGNVHEKEEQHAAENPIEEYTYFILDPNFVLVNFYVLIIFAL